MPYFENPREHIPPNSDNTQVVLFCLLAFRFASFGSVPSTRARICLEATIQLPNSRPYPPLSRYWILSKSVAWRTGLAACLRRLGQIETRDETANSPVTFHPGSATRS